MLKIERKEIGQAISTETGVACPILGEPTITLTFPEKFVREVVLDLDTIRSVPSHPLRHLWGLDIEQIGETEVKIPYNVESMTLFMTLIQRQIKDI